MKKHGLLDDVGKALLLRTNLTKETEGGNELLGKGWKELKVC